MLGCQITECGNSDLTGNGLPSASRTRHLLSGLGLAIGNWLLGSLVFVRSGVSRRTRLFGWIGLSGWPGLSGQLLFIGLMVSMIP